MDTIRRIIGYIAWEFGRRCYQPVGEVQRNIERVMLLCDLPPGHFGQHSASMSGPFRRLLPDGERDHSDTGEGDG